MRFVCIDGKEFSKKKDAIDWENKILEQEKVEFKRIKDIKKSVPDTREKRSDVGVKRARYKITVPKKYHSYLSRANAKGIAFDFSIDEFEYITSLPCTYCGSSGKIGIDRADSSEGYTKENSLPCCWPCNQMKYTHSSTDFLYHIKKIYEYNKDMGTI